MRRSWQRSKLFPFSGETRDGMVTMLRKNLECGLAALFSTLLAVVTPAAATLGVDAATLNELLPAVAPRNVPVEITEGRTLDVELEDLKVVGFDPAAGADGKGQILTRVRIKIAELGLNVNLEPKLSLKVVQQAGISILELRFDNAEVPIPLAGTVDIGSFVPPLRFPAESLFYLQGMDGEVPFRSRLTDVKMGLKVLRFEFELERE